MRRTNAVRTGQVPFASRGYELTRFSFSLMYLNSHTFASHYTRCFILHNRNGNEPDIRELLSQRYLIDANGACSSARFAVISNTYLTKSDLESCRG